MPTTEKYTHDLILALRLRDVPGERIGDVVAEVTSHVAETGEDPVEAFGSPKDYAEAVSARKVSWSTPSTLVALVLGGAAGWLLAQSVFALVLGESTLYGAPTWVMAAIGVLLGALTAYSASRRYDPVIDPRSGRRLMAGGGWPTALLMAGMLVLVAALAAMVR